MKAYHMSPMRNRLSIQRHGLKRRDPEHGRFGSGGLDEAYRNYGQPGVYVTPTQKKARWWRKTLREPGALFEVDVTGLPWEHDGYADSGQYTWRRITTDIGPDRVKYLGAVR